MTTKVLRSLQVVKKNGSLQCVVCGSRRYSNSTNTSSTNTSSTNTSSTSTNSRKDAELFDIVVAGGGMAGFAMACSLGQSKVLSSLRVLVLEGGPHTDASLEALSAAPHDNRVCAIAPPSVRLLDKLGVWHDICGVRTGLVKRMQVWDSESDAMIAFGDGHRALAHIVENRVTVAALRARVPSSIEVRYGARVQSFDLPPPATDGLPLLTLRDGSYIRARLLIGCDGASSAVRRAMNARTVGWDYGQSAVVATLQLEQEENESNITAWQKFLPNGPLAILPLRHGLSSLVWTTAPRHAQALLAMDARSFADAINSALWSNERANSAPWLESLQRRGTQLARDVGHLFSSATAAQVSSRLLPPPVVGVVEDSRASFPLALNHAVHYTANRVVLVGDAAHRVHPLAGQGANLGFGDVAALTTALETSLLLGETLGSASCLYEYERIRQRENLVMMAATDALQKLYSSTAPPLVLLRALGLAAVDAIAPIKEKIEAYVQR